MRGYFGIGVEGLSKPMNAGSLFRSAHAFGAAFVFTIEATYKRQIGRRADTSDTTSQVPLHEFDSLAEFRLPKGCVLVGVEIVPDAIDLPSFHHPHAAAYVLGAERSSLSPELLARCAHVVKIPTKFSLNVALAGALVMYDRLKSTGSYAPRPLMPGGPKPGDKPKHVFGAAKTAVRARQIKND